MLNCQGRTAIVKLESSKPLVIDPDGTLVNIHDQNHGAVPRPPQEAGQVNTITLLSATQTYKEVKKQQDIFHNSVAAEKSFWTEITEILVMFRTTIDLIYS